MTTITALQLRKNLDTIVRRVQAGERIRVTYRSKVAFTLEPETQNSNKPDPGSPEAVQSSLERMKRMRDSIPSSHIFDPDKPIKELYRDMLDDDPKHKSSYHL